MIQKILIVDDDDDIRAGLKYMIESLADADVREASDGDIAICLLVTEPPDILFLDLNLPGRGGLEILEALSSGGIGRPGYVVVMSASSRLDEFRYRLGKLGADTFLPKPFRYEGIQEILADAHAARTMVDPATSGFFRELASR